MEILLDFKNYFLRKFVDEDYQVMRFLTNGQPGPDCEVRRAMGVFLSWQKKLDAKYSLKLFKESIFELFPSDDKECVYYKLTKN